MRPLYFDHNATTPLDPRVAEAMLPWLTERVGNPSSLHAFGREAREAVERGREKVAAALGAEPAAVVFTASGSEANNQAVFSLGRRDGRPGRVVISAMEHPSVTAAAERLAAEGGEAVRVAPGRDGVVSAEAFLDAVAPGTRLACLMLANNEIGTLQPVAEVAAGCGERGVPLLCDATQAIGRVPVDVGELGVDLLSLGAHKFGGPLGAGALWARRGIELAPLLVGGGQERGRRASTENVAAVVGLGRAAELAAAEQGERHRRWSALRDRFEAGLAERFPDAVIHGRDAPRVPNTASFALPGRDAGALLVRLDLAGCAVSAGSACSSGAPRPFGTLRAMGLPDELAAASLRVSFGAGNDAAGVDSLLDELAAAAAALAAVPPAEGASP